MTRIKLLALDMDGTLFTTDKRVTTENRIALKSAEEKGVHVVITTGRPLPAIKYVLEDLQLYDDKHYSVTFNGGLVQRNNGEILDKNVMSRDQLRAIYVILEPLSIGNFFPPQSIFPDASAPILVPIFYALSWHPDS